MNSLILNPINAPIFLKVENNIVNIEHPTFESANKIASSLAKEDLDLRRLLNVSHHTYTSMGEKWIYAEWKKALNEFQRKYSNNNEIFSQLSIQAQGILKHKPIPLRGAQIKDPFNMKVVEQREPIQNLAAKQMQNTIIAKSDNDVIGIGRLLEVEESVEIVSLLTKKEWRGKGIASKIIDELLKRSSIRPIYSFQVPELVTFYFQRYQKHGIPQIEPFVQLPQALQRDLFYMNVFWGPYTIISIK